MFCCSKLEQLIVEFLVRVREAHDMHTQTSIFSSVAEYSVRFIARAMPWYLVHINVSVFLVIFWAPCHPRWFLCFYGLFLGQGAHAIYFNESGSTDMAQSYHIHEVESMPFEPNAQPEMSQGGGRPRHEPQQREDSKKSCRQNDDKAESEGRTARWDWG